VAGGGRVAAAEAVGLVSTPLLNGIPENLNIKWGVWIRE
jgi:hypothetical protein